MSTEPWKELIDRVGPDSDVVQARYGSATTFLEALAGLVVPELEGAKGRAPQSALELTTECPACTQRWCFDAELRERIGKRNVTHYRFSKGERGWRAGSAVRFERGPLSGPSPLNAALGYDDAAYSGFLLTELFRGVAGRKRLEELLSSTGTSRRRVLGVLAWPLAQRHSGASERLGRPSLVVQTDRELVSIVHQPPRAGNERLATARVDAAERVAENLAGGMRAKHLVLLREGSAAWREARAAGRVCLSWQQVLRVAEQRPPPGSERSLARLREALGLQPLTPIRGWEAALSGSRHDVFEWTWFPFRNQATLSGATSTLVCVGCGYTVDTMRMDFGEGAVRFKYHRTQLRGRPVDVDARAPEWRRFAREDPTTLDIVSELAVDRELAAETFGLLGASVGTVDRALFWPRLRPLPEKAKPAVTPDAAFTGRAAALVIEAKAPGSTPFGTLEGREVLVRCAQALFLRDLADARRAIVLVVGDVVHAKVARVVWRALESAGGLVPHWNSDKAAAVIPKDHAISRELRALGVEGLKAMVRVATWAEVSTAVENAAIRLGAQANAPRYAHVAARARGFLRLRLS